MRKAYADAANECIGLVLVLGVAAFAEAKLEHIAIITGMFIGIIAHRIFKGLAGTA